MFREIIEVLTEAQLGLISIHKVSLVSSPGQSSRGQSRVETQHQGLIEIWTLSSVLSIS